VNYIIPVVLLECVCFAVVWRFGRSSEIFGVLYGVLEFEVKLLDGLLTKETGPRLRIFNSELRFRLGF